MEIEKTLSSPFNNDNYNDFITNFFNNITRAPYQKIAPSASFANTIEYYSIHGTYMDDEGNEIIIMSVKVKQNSNARVLHRNFVSHLLSNEYNQFGAAMVAYYDDIRTNWKLSFITVQLEMSEKGIELKFKPAKRFSFLVGKDEPIKTYVQQLSPIFESKSNPSLTSIEYAFSINRLSETFYKEYKGKFYELYDCLIENEEFLAEAKKMNFKKIEKFTIAFCKKTLGQIVFLHFVQKKGWLGSCEDWHDGDKKFLINSTKQFTGNYFDEFLEPLFYEALNKKRENDLYGDSRIPFLNGGLFHPIENYDWQNTNFNIDNDFWFNENETGLLDILSQYNFTIDESDPSEQEVAIDPEMLGKIFESLLDTEDRSSLGAFYTPREIVHFMCEESLANRIVSLLDIDYNSVISFLRYGDALQDTDFIKEFAVEIDEIVSKFTIADPAVGSGAFLVGMLNQIVKLRVNLSKYIGYSPSIYNLKLEAIQNSLYGVDIEYDAVEIAKLRLWLSLIVDQEALYDCPKPLPNLNFCLRVGNSLVDNYNGIKLWSNRWRGVKEKTHSHEQINIFNVDTVATILHRLKDAKVKYFSTSDDFEKQELYKRIEIEQIELIKSELVAREQYDLLNKITEMLNNNTKPFFIWTLEFDEVFEDGGFDIIIANPPYIKEYINQEAFENLKDSPYYQGKMDLWNFFASFTLDLLKEGGVQAFIAPNNWITNSGSSKLRNKLVSESMIKKYIDFGSSMVFSTASIQTMIYILEKRKKINMQMPYTFEYTKALGSLTTEEDLSNLLYRPQNIKCINFNFEFLPCKYIDRYITFDNPKVSKTVSFIEGCKSFNLTKEDISQGIVVPQTKVDKKSLKKLGGDHYVGEGIFTLSKEEIARLELNDAELNTIRPLISSTHILNWCVVDNIEEYIIYADNYFKQNILSYSTLMHHLEKFSSVNTSSNAPYGLHRARKSEIFTGERIISLRKCATPTFALVERDACCLQTFNVIKQEKVNNHYLLGFLNSSIAKFYFKTQGKMQGSNYQIDKEPLEKLPILVCQNNYDSVVELVNNVLTGECTIEDSILSIDKLIFEEFSFDNKMKEIIYKEINNEI